jgi:hypothetical protein
MRLQAISIEPINRENFLRFGETLEMYRPDPGKAQRGEDELRTLSRTPSEGWRVGVHCVRARWTDCLYTYDSRRLLSPQRGAALVCVALPERPANVQLFVLDAPLVLNAGIPHCLLTLSAESWIQVGENFETRRQAVPLRKALAPAGIWE